MKEFEDFKKDMVSKSKEEIFRSAYKIHVMDELNDYFENGGCENLSKEDCKKLQKYDDNILSLLYDYYLFDEYGSVNNWEDIGDLIKRFLEREGKRC